MGRERDVEKGKESGKREGVVWRRTVNNNNNNNNNNSRFFLYKNPVYKNVEAQISQKIRTS